MEAKEKAEELLDKLSMYFSENAPAKQCALILIDELIKENYPTDIKRCEYWQEVKEEINKL
jgi:hypothetical protein